MRVFCFLLAMGLLAAIGILLTPERFDAGQTASTDLSDVLVVLAGDSDRLAYANDLVTRGKAARILFTLSTTPCRCHPTEPCAPGVRNTIDEALVTRRLLTEEHIHRGTIVTSRYHARRAAAVFHVVFIGSGIRVNIVAPTDSSPTPLELRVREWLKLGPSVGGALLARVAPALYKWMSDRYGEARAGPRPITGDGPTECRPASRTYTQGGS